MYQAIPGRPRVSQRRSNRVRQRSAFARLQIQPGIHGVTKVRWRTWPQRSWLTWTRAAVYLALAFTLIYATTFGHAHPLRYSVLRSSCAPAGSYWWVGSLGWLAAVSVSALAIGWVLPII